VPDAIIVDYRLREGRSGAHVIERLRQVLERDVPSLIVTGDTALESVRTAKASGHPVLHKPAPPGMLRAFLQNARRQNRGADAFVPRLVKR
jgi:DNA-binding response OmpR family regulator